MAVPYSLGIDRAAATRYFRSIAADPSSSSGCVRPRRLLGVPRALGWGVPFG